MVIATHVTFGAYGFWLPNDPRGSWSNYVRSKELLKYGNATKVETSRSLAKVSHDPALRRTAKQELERPPVKFTGIQAACIGRGFAQAVSEGNYVIHACAILPFHCHLVIAEHVRPVRMIVAHLKGRATTLLKKEALYPWDLPTPWVRRCWRKFLQSPADVLRTIKYVEENPLKEGKRKQTWRFVTGYRDLS